MHNILQYTSNIPSTDVQHATTAIDTAPITAFTAARTATIAPAAEGGSTGFSVRRTVGQFTQLRREIPQRFPVRFTLKHVLRQTMDVVVIDVRGKPFVGFPIVDHLLARRVADVAVCR